MKPFYKEVAHKRKGRKTKLQTDSGSNKKKYSI